MKKISFLGDVAKLVSGTMFAQLLTVGCAPLLARLYSPEDFGVYNIFISVITLISLVLCLRYELAIVLPENHREAVDIFWGSLGISVFLSLLSIPVVIFGRTWISNAIGSPKVSQYLWLMPASLLFGGLSYGHPSLNYWAMRLNRFGKLSIARVTSTVSTLVLQLLAGLAGFRSGGSLIDSAVIGGACSATILGVQLGREDGALLAGNFHPRQIFQAIQRYRKFPLFESWAILINNFSWLLPTFLLARYFSLTEVGFYSFTYRFLTVPMTLVGGAIAQVFFQRASVAKTTGTHGQVVEDALRKLIALGMFPILLMTIIAPSLFKIVFGDAWVEAGIYAQILGVWMLVWFISSPLHTIYSILERQDFYLTFNVIVLLVRFAALLGGGLLGEARLALAFFALSGILTHGFLLFKIAMDCGIPVGRVWKLIFVYLCKFLPAGVILAAAIRAGLSNLWLIGLSGFLLALYFLIEARHNTLIRAWLSRSGLVRNSAWLKT